MIFSLQKALDMVKDGYTLDGEDGDWYLVKEGQDDYPISDVIANQLF